MKDKHIHLSLSNGSEITYTIPSGWNSQPPNSGFFAVKDYSGVQVWINMHYVVSWFYVDESDAEDGNSSN